MTTTDFAVGGEAADDWWPSFESHEVEPPREFEYYTTQYPIPLEHRLYYIEGEELPEFYPLPDELADMIGASQDWVEHTAAELGIEELEMGGYPEYAVPVLRQEWKWQEAYEAQDETISRRKMFKLLDMPESWVENTLKQQGYTPFRTVAVRGSLTEGQYIKGIAQHLRAIKMSVRPAGTWSNAAELSEKYGRSWRTVVKFATDNGFESQQRRSRRSGRMGPHYSPELELVLKGVEIGSKEPEWYTRRDIRELTGHGSKWVDKSITPYIEFMQMMPDDGNRLREHYPKKVVDKLMVMSKEEDEGLLPMEPGDIAVVEFALLAHRNVDTVYKILEYMQKAVVLRLNANRQHVPTCQIELVEQVRDFDTTLLQDRAELAKNVSVNRKKFRIIEGEIEQVDSDIKELRALGGHDDDVVILRLKRAELCKERENTRGILGRAARRFDSYLKASEAYKRQLTICTDAEITV